MKKRNTRRTGKKKRGFKRLRRFKPRIAYGLPQTQVVRLRFADEVTLDPTANIATQVYSALSLHTPRVGSSHQPMYYDTWTLLYDYYTVIGSKCRMTPCTTNPSAQYPGYYGIILDQSSDATAVYTNMTDAFENVGATGWKILAPTSTKHGRNGSVVKKYSPRKFWNIGKNDKVTLMEGLTGAFGASPTKVANYTCYYGTAGAATINPGAMYFLVEIEYLALLNSPVQQSRN